MLDTTTSHRPATETRSEAGNETSTVDAVIIIQRARNNQLAMYLDPVRPNGVVHYRNDLDQPVRLKFEEDSPYPGDRTIPISDANDPRDEFSPPFIEGVEQGIYRFRVEDLSGTALVQGLQIEVDADGVEAGRIALKHGDDSSETPLAIIRRMIPRGTDPAMVEVQTRPTTLSATVFAAEGDPPELVLDQNTPSGRMSFQRSLGAKYLVELDATDDLVFHNQSEDDEQGGGTRQAEIIIDP